MFTAPVAALTPWQRRVFFWLTTAALGLILLWAAQARSVWPRWPLADPDTWGYLHPALSKLQGGPFEHTNGRNFVYPGFLYLVLRVTGDFGAIAFAQHALGLVGGVLLWTAWRQWRGLFTSASRLPAWADAALGLSLVAFYTRSLSEVHFEMQIRPEGVFACFAAAQLCLLLGFVRAWWGVVRRPERAAVFAGANLFAAALLYQLKPSYGLAVGVSALPVAWAVAFPWRQEARARWRLAGAAAAAGLAALVLFVLPEHEFNKADPNTQLFLPETLLTVHAATIRDQLLADVRTHAPTPFNADWLAYAAVELDREVRRASEPAARPWRSLGHNPDFLMYRDDSFCRWLFETSTRRQIVLFCYGYYWRAWAYHPGAMLAKIGRQLELFYTAPCPAFWAPQKLKLERFYDRTVAAFGDPASHGQMLAYPPAAAYLEAAESFGYSDTVIRPSTWLTSLNLAAARGFLALQVLFLAGLVVAARFVAPGVRRRVALPGAALLLVHGVLFGNCLTVAVVHSFSIDRYSFNLLLYAALCEVAAAVWLYELAWTFVVGEPAPAAPAAPTLIAFHPPTPPSP